MAGENKQERIGEKTQKPKNKKKPQKAKEETRGGHYKKNLEKKKKEQEHEKGGRVFHFLLSTATPLQPSKATI
jgi:hypothetical protein